MLAESGEIKQQQQQQQKQQQQQQQKQQKKPQTKQQKQQNSNNKNNEQKSKQTSKTTKNLYICIQTQVISHDLYLSNTGFHITCKYQTYSYFLTVMYSHDITVKIL